MTQLLRRQLAGANAVVLGLSGMIGAGVFAGFAPAVAVAGFWFLPALILPAALALCCAVSTAAQARACPGIGGGYVAAREYLGRWPGRITGSLHTIGSSAAAAAVAGILGSYLWPAYSTRAAIVALAAVTVINGLRLSWPAAVDRVLLGSTLAVLLVVVIACFAVPAPPSPAVTSPVGLPGAADLRGLPSAAAMLFFAFAGFERLTGQDTGEGLSSRPRRRAVLTVLGLAALLYLAVGLALVHQLGSARLALSPAPLRDALAAADGGALQPLLLLAAPAAMMPVLIWVHTRVRDVLRAMHGTGDLWLPGAGGSKPSPRFDLLAGALSVVFVLVLSPAAAMTFAVACLLAYFMFTNAATRVMLREENPWPTRTACIGMILSVVLLMTLPVTDLAGVLVVGGAGAGLAAVSDRWARYRSRL